MASRSLNKIMLIGNLTRDPELRYTPSGTAVCTFGLATNRSWQPEGGERQEETEFHRIVSWQKLAELCSQLLFKGRKVYVEGRIQTRSWTSQDGQERSATEVVIDNMIILDSRRKPGEEGFEGASQGVPQAAVAAVSDVKKRRTVVKKTVAVKKTAVEEQAKEKAPAPAVTEETKEEVKADDIPF
jgi:single-strand DNA-binding protein